MRTILSTGIGALALAAAMQPAAAADLAVRAPVYKAPPPIVAVYNWTGFYIGGNVGYSWGRANTDLAGSARVQVFRTAGPDLVFDSGPIGAGLNNTSNVDGWIGGFQAGYNVQQGSWLWGIEADIQASGERGDQFLSFVIPAFVPGGGAAGATPATAVTIGAEHKLTWFGTLRGRLGVLPSERVLLYVTGGLAYGELESNYLVTLGGVGSVAVGSKTTKAGYVVGAGVEGALWGNWTAKAEYLYMDLGTFDVAGASAATNQLNTPSVGFNTVTTFNASASTRFTDHIFRVGLNYHFYSPAVIAKY
jgi:outer membrane immunogenic protein